MNDLNFTNLRDTPPPRLVLQYMHAYDNNPSFEQFAKDNNFTLTSHQAYSGDKLGLPFLQKVKKSEIIDSLEGMFHGLHHTLFHYIYVLKTSGHSIQRLRLAVMEFDLTQSFPQVIIEYPSRPMIDLWSFFKKAQEVDLGENYKRYVHMYAPVAHHTALRQQLTPDKLDKLLSLTHNMAIEIVGNKLYFYQSGDFDGTTATYKAMYNNIGQALDLLLPALAPVAAQNTAVERLETTNFAMHDKAGALLIVVILLVLIPGGYFVMYNPRLADQLLLPSLIIFAIMLLLAIPTVIISQRNFKKRQQRLDEGLSTPLDTRHK